MPRFFLHLRDGTDQILDPEGIVYENEEAMRRFVLDNARDTISQEIRSSGTIDLRYRIDAEDDAGNIVYSLPFTEAVSILREH
jgi:hypothetical protein